MIIGTIKSLGRNRIDIYDEDTRTVRSLIYLDHASNFHPGQRVRIDYERDNNVVQSIKEMTPLGRTDPKQNFGYLTLKNISAIPLNPH